jgi:pimeloyl-ACP methyl ester carboxylesterase
VAGGTFDLDDGARLRLVRVGDPDAELTTILVHSYALDLRVWHKVVEVLPRATEYPIQVLAYDQRGHGDSSQATAATATVERLGDDLAELIERAVPHGRIVLVGHGMGGLVCMSLAARHQLLFSVRVAGLVFLSTAASWVAAALPQSVGRVVQDLEAILGTRLLGHVIGKAKTIGLRWLLLGDDPDPEDARLVAEMISRHWPETVALFRPAYGADRGGRDAGAGDRGGEGSAGAGVARGRDGRCGRGGDRGGPAGVGPYVAAGGRR